MPFLYVPMPRDELIKEYEIVKTKFSKELDEQTMNVLQQDDVMKKMTPQQKQIWDMNQAGLKNTEIAEEMGWSSPGRVGHTLNIVAGKYGLKKKVNFTPTGEHLKKFRYGSEERAEYDRQKESEEV